MKGSAEGFVILIYVQEENAFVLIASLRQFFSSTFLYIFSFKSLTLWDPDDSLIDKELEPTVSIGFWRKLWFILEQSSYFLKLVLKSRPLIDLSRALSGFVVQLLPLETI